MTYPNILFLLGKKNYKEKACFIQVLKMKKELQVA